MCSYGDLNLQSAAVQIFMPRAAVGAFDEFTYEHVTRVRRRGETADDGGGGGGGGGGLHGRMRRAASRGGGGTMAPHGTVVRSVATAAAPANDGATPPSASFTAGVSPSALCIDFGGLAAGSADPNGYTRVLEAARAGHFCRPPCVRAFLHHRRLVLAATVGAVKIEKHSCEQRPPPHFCTSGSNYASRGTPEDEDAQANNSTTQNMYASPPPSPRLL